MVFSDADPGDSLTYSRLSSSGDTVFNDLVNPTTSVVDLLTIANASGTQTLVFQAVDTTGGTATLRSRSW
ncbi:MAG: hypothetical protein R3E84_06105 [Pseudomonadales bacterium]